MDKKDINYKYVVLSFDDFLIKKVPESEINPEEDYIFDSFKQVRLALIDYWCDIVSDANSGLNTAKRFSRNNLIE